MSVEGSAPRLLPNFCAAGVARYSAQTETTGSLNKSAPSSRNCASVGSRIDKDLILDKVEADPLYTRTLPLRKVKEARILEVGSAAYCFSAVGSDESSEGFETEALRGILSVSRVTRS